ncbi:MAG: hypothetical protein NAG76_02130 [Candidatus Pristimantibacillus lignocellulolyticus]|uniref:Uncharacterized protein n=1 Tax=Candidatus Pristimantibacillus lignocellulolyticus TaxID=2994561 RepID=A0A9J6ZGB3_9BACL|nr:MAG: hypothetical protein NAG76_02130 [Candidatus Pristimantibacillus lignocellulolyticus]
MNQENKFIGIFIGARDLKEEVYKVLPGFDMLVKQIELLRPEQPKILKKSEYEKSINNTIAIFGERGTGKSSVLYTLINKFKNKNGEISENILLPIIEPDHFGENTKIMGSIVGFLKKAANNQLEAIKKAYNSYQGEEKKFDEYYEQGNYKINNPLKLKIDEVIEYHMYTANEYRKLLVHNYDDLSTHIKKSSHLLISDVEFKEKLNDLISLLIINQRRLLSQQKKNEGKNREPLIFIFIDDIDLKMTRTKELIESLLQYINHPNVVTILSGDYAILQESMMLALIQEENLPSSNLNVEFSFNSLTTENEKNTIKSRKEYLAHEYLKKIIPPARRFQLVQWNEKTIPNFSMNDYKLSSLLQDIFGKSSLFSYQKLEILYPIPIESSYVIFDHTPRGIINVYYHLSQLLNRHENDDSKFLYVKSLIDTIIHSSTILTKNQSFIFSEFIKWGSDEESSYIGYGALLNLKTKLDNSKNEIEKYETNCMIRALYIIGSIISELLPKIKFNLDERKIWWKNVVNILFKSDNFDSLTYPLDKMEKNNRHYFSQLIRILFNYMEEINTLILINELDPYKSWLLQQEGQMTLYEFEIHERQLIIALNEFLSRDEYVLLKKLYLEQYSKAKLNYKSVLELTSVLQFINDAIKKEPEETYYRTLYFINGFKKIKIGKFEIDELITDYKNIIDLKDMADKITKSKQEELLLALLVKTIIHINRHKDNIRGILTGNQLIEDDKSENDKKTEKLVKTFRKLNEGKSFKNLNINQKNALNRQIEIFKDSLESYLFDDLNILDLKVNLGENSKFQSELRLFENGSAGITNTNYKKTKANISKIINKVDIDSTIPFLDYIVMREILSKLANNIFVWYGRNQAKRLLKVLDHNCYLDFDNFLDVHLEGISVIKEYLEQTTDAIHKDDGFEKARLALEENMQIAFDNAMENTRQDLELIGIELSEDEDEEGSI